MSSNARKYVASKYRYLGQLISGQRSKIFNPHALMIEKNSTYYHMMLIKRKNKRQWQKLCSSSRNDWRDVLCVVLIIDFKISLTDLHMYNFLLCIVLFLEPPDIIR